MDREKEQAYLQLAQDNPNMICSEVPLEVLEEAAYTGDEPLEFVRDFLATGHTQWIAEKHGRRVQLSKNRINNAVIVLWIRASRLYTSHLLDRPDDNWNKPVFSDEGLYGER